MISEVVSHLDPRTLIQAGGLVGVTLIVFAETGLFVGFFFPGDSLLFTAGFFASQHLLDIRLLLLCLFIASVIGNMVGYAFGKRVGPKLFSREDSLFFHKNHLEKTRVFFEKHGNKAIFFARFFPIMRTFTPIFAGIARMNYRSFVLYTLLGGFVWTWGLTLLGYVLGNVIPDIDRYLLPIIAGIVAISLLPGIIHILRGKATS
ncbi:VTT domain-containing protein [Candidatus Uhrbacteria bacterium]|nr:VTT domain-containing protein [Candidatus Uhrbacteria bacterium]